MLHTFVRKLESITRLSDEQRLALEALVQPTERLRARETFEATNDGPPMIDIVLSGWGCRYKVLPDDRRQIIGLLLPGDICDPYVFRLRTLDHQICALTPVTLAKIPAQVLRDGSAGGVELAEAIWWQMLEAVEIQREWTVSLGRRTAIERMAHLFCEISARLRVAGLTPGPDCEMPMTQVDLADVLGLSSVHLNRSLQTLRSSGLVELRNKRLTILDRQALMQLATFDPAYLQLGLPEHAAQGTPSPSRPR